jgi:hypothetical protein
MFTKDDDGNIIRTEQKKAKTLITKVKSLTFSESQLHVESYDFKETYLLEESPTTRTLRLKNSATSKLKIVDNFNHHRGDVTKSLRHCQDSDRKAQLIRLHSKEEPVQNETNPRARAWHVALTEKEIKSLPSAYINSEISLNREDYTDDIYTNGLNIISGPSPDKLDSRLMCKFENANFDIDIKVVVFRNTQAAHEIFLSKKNLINSGGEFSTVALDFDNCGDESFGAQWKEFSPHYVCRLKNYLVEIRTGDFSNDATMAIMRSLTTDIMKAQINKIKLYQNFEK